MSSEVVGQGHAVKAAGGEGRCQPTAGPGGVSAEVGESDFPI